MTTQKLLVETLKQLSPEEFDEFKSLIGTKKGSLLFLKAANTQDAARLLAQTYDPQCVEVSREAFRKMRRTDLLQRLSGADSGAKEKRPERSQRVETMTTQKLLVETLNQLSPEEFDEFKSLIWTKKGSLLFLKAANTQDAARLLAQTYGPQCVEVSREAFRKMRRTDLLQRLSGADSGAKEKRPERSQRVSNITSVHCTQFSFETEDQHLKGQFASFDMKLDSHVEMMESTLELLLETLADLSDGELRAFKDSMQLQDFKESSHLYLSRYSMTNQMFMEMTDLHNTVYSMVQLYGQRSVEETKKILIKMRKKDLVQRLSNPKKEKLHESALIHKMAAMLAVKQLLLDTLMKLKGDELSRFRWFLHLTQFKKDLPQIPWSKLSDANNREIVDLMVNIYGQHCVEVTRETFMDMNRTDLAQRLPESSFGPKEKHAGGECFPALIHKIKTMESVTELLLEKLAELSDRSLKDFWITFFRKTQQVGPHYVEPWTLLDVPNIQDLVFSMVQTYGQQAVEQTEKILQEIKETDQLAESSFGPEKKLSVGEQRGLIHKVATVAAVKQLLLGTLNDLKPEELLKFRRLLMPVTFLTFGSASWSRTESSTGTVDEMVMEFGQQSVELTRKVLEYLNRTDLVQRFLETSSAPNKKLSVGEQRGLIHKVSYLTAVKHLLLETLNDLSDEELNRFGELMISQENLSHMSWTWLHADRLLIAYVMVEELNQQSVEVVSETLMEMKKTDLVQRLTDRSSVLKEELSGDEHGAALLKAIAAETADKQILLETLKSLSKTDLLKFTWLLELTCFQRGVPEIPHYKLEYRPMTAEIVNLVVELGQQWVEVTKEVFMDMNRTDLVQKLSETSSASKGPSGSLKPEGRGSGMQGSGGWTKLEPEVNSSDTDEAPTYSLQSDVGHFECSISGLRWVCKEKVGFSYQFGSWDGHMERMESRRYSPAGPLMDVTVTAGRLDEVHLPHWICIDDIPNLLHNFAVLHINDCGEVLEKVSEVTPTHVTLAEPSFTSLAALINSIFRVKINCNMLIYYQPNEQFLKLRVYLIPHDAALQQKVHKEESSSGYEVIKKHRPDTPLKIHQGFTLTASMDAARIQPKKLTLRYDSQDPNFFEVFIERPYQNFDLRLYVYSKRDKPVWSCEIRKVDHPKSGAVEAAGSSGGAACGPTSAEAGASGFWTSDDGKFNRFELFP
ncbi:uncharacterized protein PAE49_005727 [Odontesthes bonariensis]|uniref:uncharacterized protein LOC142380616 n=1 Tax=Odontesthes bonariensis TaxID=219752 RepID=UPI003F58993E